MESVIYGPFCCLTFHCSEQEGPNKLGHGLSMNLLRPQPDSLQAVSSGGTPYQGSDVWQAALSSACLLLPHDHIQIWASSDWQPACVGQTMHSCTRTSTTVLHLNQFCLCSAQSFLCVHSR